MKITGGLGKSCFGRVMGPDGKPEWGEDCVGNEEMKTDFQEILLLKGDEGLKEDFFTF